MVPIDGFAFGVSVSEGAEERGAAIAAIAAVAFEWLCGRLGWQPAVRLTVADERDWPEVAPVPVYGVPQTWGDHTIVAAGRAPLFDDMAAFLMGESPEAGQREMAAAYGDPPDLSPYFDLQVVHELAHLFGEQIALRPAPLWVDELRCNLAMAGFVAEKRPDALPQLRAAARASAHVSLDQLGETALHRMGESFDAGQRNFGWYQLRLTDLADRLWHAGEAELDVALYELLRAPGPGEPATVQLDEIVAVSPALAEAVEGWPAAG